VKSAGSAVFQTPLGPLKSGIPDSVEIPAPVNSNIRCLCASRDAAISTVSVIWRTYQVLGRWLHPDSLEVDDVITYRRGTVDVIHRIVSIERTADGLVITTKGDNVGRADPPIGEADVEGKVVFRLPQIGRVGLWLRDLF
jgi:hypothetical protein